MPLVVYLLVLSRWNVSDRLQRLPKLANTEQLPGETPDLKGEHVQVPKEF